MGIVSFRFYIHFYAIAQPKPFNMKPLILTVLFLDYCFFVYSQNTSLRFDNFNETPSNLSVTDIPDDYYKYLVKKDAQIKYKKTGYMFQRGDNRYVSTTAKGDGILYMEKYYIGREYDELASLVLAKKFELESLEYEKERKKKDSDLIVAFNKINNPTKEQIENLKNLRKANQKEYDDKIDESYNNSLENWSIYRHNRWCEWGNFWGKKLAWRTKYYMENNIDNKFQLFTSASSSVSPNGRVAVYSEILKDYFWIWQLSIGAMVQSKVKLDSAGKVIDSTETRDATFQRIVSGGGNLTMKLSTPIVQLKFANNYVRIPITLNIPISLTIPAMSFSATTKSDVYVYPNLYGTGYLRMLDGDIVFFCSGTIGQVIGSQEFYDNVRIPEGHPMRSEGFALFQYQVGLAIQETYRITVNWNTGTNSFVKQNYTPFTVSLTLIK